MFKGVPNPSLEYIFASRRAGKLTGQLNGLCYRAVKSGVFVLFFVLVYTHMWLLLQRDEAPSVTESLVKAAQWISFWLLQFQ